MHIVCLTLACAPAFILPKNLRDTSVTTPDLHCALVCIGFPLFCVTLQLSWVLDWDRLRVLEPVAQRKLRPR